MNKDIKKYKYSVVENETGVVISQHNEGKFTPNEEIEYQQKYITNFNKGESFVKLYDKTIAVLRKKLTPTEFMLAFSLAEYVSYKDCILRHDGKILTMQDIADLLDMDYSSVRRLIPSLVHKGILGVHYTGCIDKPKVSIKVITCNPYIYVRGTDVERYGASLFENNGWDKLLND